MLKIAKKTLKIFITILLGTSFTLIIFEISLFSFGKLEKNFKKIKNSFLKEKEFVILTLGESTTASKYDFNMNDYSWPVALEKSLNKSHPEKKVKVINAGMSGINSNRILKDLEKNIEKYEPNLVISMMGVNDLFEGVLYETEAGIEEDNILSKLRIYKLIKILIATIEEKNELKVKRNLDCYCEQSCIDLAIKQKTDSYLETELAIKFLEKALDYNPKNTDALLDLGYRYMSDYNVYNERDSIKAIGIFEKALEIDVENPRFYFALIDSITQSDESIDNTLNIIEYVELSTMPPSKQQIKWLKYGRKYRQKLKQIIRDNYRKIENRIEKYKINDRDVFLAMATFAMYYENILVEEKTNQFFYLEKALEIDPNHTYSLFSLARYYAENDNLQEAEEFYLRALNGNQKDDVYIMALIELTNIYLGTNRKELAKNIFKQALDAGGMYIRNYKKLYQILSDKNIKLIAVQYPMRSVGVLELIFEDNDNVLLVDNELLFKNLVREEGYDQIFVDRFAGDFGHCSERGNLFLAENIASVILDNWDEISGENQRFTSPLSPN